MSKYPDVKITNLPGYGEFINSITFPDSSILSALDFEGDKGDWVVVSYPKSGTTWMLYLLQQLRGGEEIKQNLSNHFSFLERFGKQSTESMLKPRLVKTHLNFDLIKNNPDVKYVVVARHPKDVAVSYYHHIVGFDKTYNWKHGQFNDFFQLFIEGKIPYGDYFKVVPNLWSESQRCKNVYFILYENMKTNYENEIKMLARFLGDDIEKNLLANDEKLLRKITSATSFQSMQKNDKVFAPANIERVQNMPFTRKGVIGDWKNFLTPKQSAAIDKKLEEANEKFPKFKLLWSDYENIFS